MTVLAIINLILVFLLGIITLKSSNVSKSDYVFCWALLLLQIIKDVITSL